MNRHLYSKFLLAGVSATAVLVGAQDAQVALADQTHSGTTTAGVEITDYTGNFTNNGNISDSTTGVWSDDAFTGNFTNNGDIEGGAYGVIFKDTFDGGNFTNIGNISATSTGSVDAYGVFFNSTFDGNFTNSENIEGDDYGVYFAGAFGANTTSIFTNSGNISVTSGTGVYFADAFDGNFTNEGEIEGDNYGVYFADTFGANTASIFTNSGNITSSGGVYGLYVAGNFTGDLINTGNISGTGDNYIYIGNFTGSMTQPVGVRVDVGGTANLSNETYSVYVDGFVEDGTQWDAIKAGTAVDLTDYTLTDNSYMVSFDGDLDDNTLTLTATVDNNVSDMACGDHGLAQEVEDALKDEDDIPDKLESLVDLLFTAGTADEVAATIRGYSPVSGPGHGVLGNSQQITDQLADRLRPNNESGTSTWGSFIGGVGDFDTCSGYDTITAGVIGGFEGPVNDDAKVGVAMSYIYANLEGKNGLAGNEANIHSLGPAFYVRYQPYSVNGLEFVEGLYAQGSVAGTYSFIDQTREALMTGEQFDADYSGFSVSGRVEVGYDAPLGLGYLTPYAATGFNFVALNDYSESGDGDGLDVSDFDGVFPMVEGGLRAAFIGEQVGLSALAGYRHEFGDEDILASASLDSTSFDTSTTLDPVGNGFIAGLEANAWYGNVVFGVSYDGLFGEDKTSHIGNVTFSFHM